MAATNGAHASDGTRSHDRTKNSNELNEVNGKGHSSTAPTDEVWFDGVSKKLLEVHTKRDKLVDGDDRTLITKTPLSSLSHCTKKRKSKKEQSNLDGSTEKKPVKKSRMINGVHSHNSSGLLKPNTGVTDELALDCEMVGCYNDQSVLARVSIVNLFGHPILDKYVAPPAKVTNYRTRYSGIRRKDLVGAPSFEEVQKEVADLIRGRIVVGHAIHNDFAVLKLSHPSDMIRDTSHHYKYLFQGKSPSLKKLCESVLGIKIQKGEHDSVQDAQATMKLYVRDRDNWNDKVAKNSQLLKKQGVVKRNKSQQHKKPKKKKTKTFYVLTN